MCETISLSLSLQWPLTVKVPRIPLPLSLCSHPQIGRKSVKNVSFPNREASHKPIPLANYNIPVPFVHIIASGYIS